MTAYDLDKWEQRKAAALAILAASDRLSRAGGSFLGQCVADPSPLSPKQTDWLIALADKAGVAVEAPHE